MYLTEGLKMSENLYNTRSNDNIQLHVPRCNTRFGERSFDTYAPKLWNNLPYYIKNSPNLFMFKKQLKYHLLNTNVM